MAYEAKVIADSHCGGFRLTTMQLTHPRIIHAEFNTHCAFARCASSSRAIPFEKMLERVEQDPFIPVWWGKNQKGMQAAEELNPFDQETAVDTWLRIRDYVAQEAKALAHKDGLNVHKQIVNRLIETWSWITVCVTGDDYGWANYFSLRCHTDAQPEIRKQAFDAQYQYFTHAPKRLEKGEWHLPYVSEEEKGILSPNVSLQVSAGRCARTSFLSQEGKRDIQADMTLHDRLVDARPIHASPLEHLAQATADKRRYGKYHGFHSYRHMLPEESATSFVPNHPALIADPSLIVNWRE